MMSFYVGNIVNWMISIVWKEARQLEIEIEKEGVKEITLYEKAIKKNINTSFRDIDGLNEEEETKVVK